MSRTVVAQILVGLSLSTLGWGQASSSINGNVTDPTGAVIPNAKITVTEVETSLTRTTGSSSDGLYVITSLRPTTYTLAVEAPGFQTLTQRGITLLANDSVTINLKLELGSAAQSVTVEATAAQTDTTTATLRQVVDSQRIVELPLNGRNAAQLTTLVAGSVLGPTNSADQGVTKTFPVAVTASINGTRTNQTSFLLDGVPNNELLSNVNLPFPMPDALQEFSVQTSNYSAEYGQNAGGVVNIVTRSGTNGFHGDLFDYWRNGIFNARNFFSSTVDPLKRQQYGASVGGPIIRNKLFFFAGYQGTNVRTFTGGLSAYVPTNGNLVGDFSALLSASNPNNPLGKAVILNDPTTGKPLVNNQIAPNLLDQASSNLAQNWFPRTGGKGLIFYSEPLAQNFDEETTRIDYNISDQDRLAFRYFRDSFAQPAQLLPHNILTYSDYGNIIDTSPELQETHIFSPSLLNDARFGVVIESDGRGPPTNAPSLASLGILGVYPTSVPSIESMSATGYWSTGTFPPGEFPRVAFIWSDSIRYIRGRHSFAAGGQYERDRLDEATQTTRGGTFAFTGETGLGSTGDALADFMSGKLRTFSQGNGTAESNRHNFYDIWATDTFKVNSRLTLNYGVRWEPSLPYHDKYHTAEIFFPNLYLSGVRSQIYTNALPGELFPGDAGIPPDGRKADYGNVAPRFGFAYDVFGDGKTSIRGGAGIFYDARIMGWNTNLTSQTQPFSYGITLTTPQGPFSNPYLGITNPFPVPHPTPMNLPFPQPVTVISMPTSLKIKAPVAYNANLTIEHQIGSAWLLRAAYVATHSSDLYVNEYGNPSLYIPGSTLSTTARRIYQGYGAITYGGVAGGNAFYNSLQLSLQKRLSKGFTILANYTWSKSLDNMPIGVDASNIGNAGAYVIPITMPNYEALDKGPSDFNRDHVVSISYVWLLPSPKTNALLRTVLGGWELNGIITAQSGGQLNATAGTDRSLTADGRDRAQLVSTQGIYTSGACANVAPCVNFLNPQDFALPALGTFGNVGKGYLVGPGIFNWDMAAAKSFQIHERFHAQLRGEYFNATNHPNFNAPATSLSGAGFGQITGAAPARIGQLALKVTF